MSVILQDKPVTRQEHLEWCKKRAMEAMTDGNMAAGWASFLQDMDQHPETKNHVFLETGSIMVFGGQISTLEEMKKHINGFG